MLARRLTAILVAALCITALAIQLHLAIDRAHPGGHSVGGAILNYFSYFTILTNLAIAALLGATAANASDARIWNRPSANTALAVYIIVVATVYATLLRHLYAPSGIEFLAERTLHLVVPALFVGYWLILIPKGTLRLKDQLGWLVLPAVFFVWTLVHGALTGFYPYPFLNVAERGYTSVLWSGLLFSAFFLTLGTVLIIVDWLLGSLQNRWSGEVPTA
ncbi:membrane protein [Rhodomicrobium udaipurense JA643]|uniref:Pr6Pr family membrane protein n=1 Tax=Rhodomicrobium udaipurense TaxID=1202716 RepID=A0A8I1KL50_9HYPH|nr:Pr6Pr family membrane protein [Rhodomicrobium udaipurense]KAI95721.1 membrane protein [Rhodomicrobium udaipurense JA643]MBJ7544929.1 Pr6Pr family membrane protein [Rhodomicrobium udaipurense]